MNNTHLAVTAAVLHRISLSAVVASQNLFEFTVQPSGECVNHEQFFQSFGATLAASQHCLQWPELTGCQSVHDRLFAAVSQANALEEPVAVFTRALEAPVCRFTKVLTADKALVRLLEVKKALFRSLCWQLPSGAVVLVAFRPRHARVTRGVANSLHHLEHIVKQFVELLALRARPRAAFWHIWRAAAALKIRSRAGQVASGQPRVDLVELPRVFVVRMAQRREASMALAEERGFRLVLGELLGCFAARRRCRDQGQVQQQRQRAEDGEPGCTPVRLSTPMRPWSLPSWLMMGSDIVRRLCFLCD